MSRKKGAAIAIIVVIAAIGGIAAYSAMPTQQEAGPAPVVTTIDRASEQENDSTTIAEDTGGQPQQNGTTTIANNTVIANNTIIINKPVYRNNTVIYQPVTINLENYRTAISQHVELEGGSGADHSQEEEKEGSHSLTISAKRIKAEGWSARFAGDGVGMFVAVYDIAGKLVKSGFADERGLKIEGLENKLYFVYPADCADCNNSRSDIMFAKWEDGSEDRPRLVPADSDVTASYRLVVEEKRKQVPLIPPPGETDETNQETETAAEPELTLAAHNATYSYGWVQINAQLENRVDDYDEIALEVYAPGGTLVDSFSYSDQQGFFAARENGEGNYRIVATYDYGAGIAEAEILHPIKFATPEFVNLEAAPQDSGAVRLSGLLRGGLAGENVTIAIHDPDDALIKQYATSFGTRPIFTLFIRSEEAGSIFNQTGNYTFAVTHLPTGVQGNATLSYHTGETETSATPLNISDNDGESERASIAVQDSRVYAVWQDDTSGQHEILFAKSDDAGATFSEPVAIGTSEQGGFSVTPDVAVSDDSVHVVWADYNSDEQSAAALRSSGDGGETFGNTKILGNYTGEGAYPQVAFFGDDIYVSWITGAEEEFAGDLMLARSADGATFEAALVSEDAADAVMAASGGTLYLAWSHHPSGDTTEGGTNMFATSPDGIEFEVSEDLQGMTIYSMAASADAAYVAGTVNGTVVVARYDGAGFNMTDLGSGDSPDVTASGSDVHAVWEQDGEIMFAASTDSGETFGGAKNVSNTDSLSYRPATAAAYVAWAEGAESADIMVAAQ